MKITIKASCLGKDGEHLEEGSVLQDYDDATAIKLIRLGRAVGDEQAENDGEGDDVDTATVDELLKLSKGALLDIAATEEVEVTSTMNKLQIAEAIVLKRTEAA